MERSRQDLVGTCRLQLFLRLQRPFQRDFFSSFQLKSGGIFLDRSCEQNRPFRRDSVSSWAADLLRARERQFAGSAVQSLVDGSQASRHIQNRWGTMEIIR